MRSVVGSGFLSLLLHVVLLLALTVRDWRLAPPPVPIEVRTMRRVTPPPPPPPPPADAPPAPPKEKAGGPGPKRRPAAKKSPAPPPPLPPPPPATADLRPFAPGDARIVILLRTDRLRASVHRAGVATLLEALPDYATLLAGSGLTPIDDLDALLIATANPFDVSATFLAARHAADGRVRAALERRAIPEWDTRRLRYVDDTLTLLARPLLAAPSRAAAPGSHASPPPAPSGPRVPAPGQAPSTPSGSAASAPSGSAASAPSGSAVPPPSGAAGSAPSGAGAPPLPVSGSDAGVVAEDPEVLEARWLEALRRFEQAAGDKDGPVVLVSIDQLDALVHLRAGFPTPLAIAVAATAEASPSVQLQAGFEDPEHAHAFAALWPDVLRSWHERANYLGLGTLFDGLKLEERGPIVVLAGRLPELQVRVALSLVQALMPRTHAAHPIGPPPAIPSGDPLGAPPAAPPATPPAAPPATPPAAVPSGDPLAAPQRGAPPARGSAGTAPTAPTSPEAPDAAPAAR